MGTICIIFAVLITVFVLMLGQYNDVAMDMALMYTNIEFRISFLTISLIIYAFGIFSGVLLMLSSFFDAQGRYMKLKKQYEITDIGNDEATEKIELLENKIKTLETALKNSIENKE